MEIEVIQNKIHEVRGCKVMLDFDLAMLYEVETKVLNQAVKRNVKRFPVDFMFQLSDDELERKLSEVDDHNDTIQNILDSYQERVDDIKKELKRKQDEKNKEVRMQMSKRNKT